MYPSYTRSQLESKTRNELWSICDSIIGIARKRSKEDCIEAILGKQEQNQDLEKKGYEDAIAGKLAIIFAKEAYREGYKRGLKQKEQQEAQEMVADFTQGISGDNTAIALSPTTCSNCPFARRIEGDKYECTATHNHHNPVVRGHWEATADCEEAIAEYDGSDLESGSQCQDGVCEIPQPGTWQHDAEVTLIDSLIEPPAIAYIPESEQIETVMGVACPINQRGISIWFQPHYPEEKWRLISEASFSGAWFSPRQMAFPIGFNPNKSAIQIEPASPLRTIYDVAAAASNPRNVAAVLTVLFEDVVSPDEVVSCEYSDGYVRVKLSDGSAEFISPRWFVYYYNSPGVDAWLDPRNWEEINRLQRELSEGKVHAATHTERGWKAANAKWKQQQEFKQRQAV